MIDLNTLDPNRLHRQIDGVNRWVKVGAIGTAEYCTGYGKTIVAMIAIKRMRTRYPNASVIVSVPTDYLREQWKALVQEWDIDNIYIDTWHVIVTNNHQCDLLIVDEIHSNAAPESGKVFYCVEHKYLLGLTGSLRDDPEATAFINKVAPVFDTILLKEAEEKGWVSNFTVYNLGVKYSEKDQKEYQSINRKFIKYFSTFNFDFNTAMSAISKPDVIRRIAKDLQWEEKQVTIHAAMFGRTMRERKQFIYEADCLFDTTVALINAFPDKKIITFGESTKLADNLADHFPESSRAFHSNLETILRKGKKFGKLRRKKEAIDLFLNDDIQQLHTAKALNVGADIKGVDMSIVYGFNSSLVDSVQRTGRAIRYAPDKHAIEINVYIMGTQAEKWLRNKQRKTPNIKWIESIEQISSTH